MLQLVEIVRPVVREHFFHCFNIKAYYLFPEGDIEPVQIERGYTGKSSMRSRSGGRFMVRQERWFSMKVRIVANAG